MFKLNENAKPFKPSFKTERTNSKIEPLNKSRYNKNSILKEKNNLLSNLGNKSKLDNSDKNIENKQKKREIKTDEKSNKNIITYDNSRRYFKRDYRFNIKSVSLQCEKLLEHKDYPSAISVFEYLNI